MYITHKIVDCNLALPNLKPFHFNSKECMHCTLQPVTFSKSIFPFIIHNFSVSGIQVPLDQITSQVCYNTEDSINYIKSVGIGNIYAILISIDMYVSFLVKKNK